MLLKDYIKDKLSSFGYDLSTNELNALMIDNSIDDTDDYESILAKKVIANIIPELLLIPESVTEGGYSVKYNREGLLTYYNILCEDLGIENKLVEKQPTIKNLSNRW